MRLLVVRCLAFAVVQALMRPRGNAGAICLTGAASSALTGERSVSVCAFAGARYWIKTLGRSVGTDLICQSGQAVERDEASA